jgi:hypothetical protein
MQTGAKINKTQHRRTKRFMIEFLPSLPDSILISGLQKTGQDHPVISLRMVNPGHPLGNNGGYPGGLFATSYYYKSSASDETRQVR